MKNDTQPKLFDRKEFANRLKVLLKAKGITQEEFANKLGAKRQTIGNYVTGERVPSVELVFEMAQILKVSIDYFLGLSPIQSPDTNIQEIHNKTGLSEEVISSLQREMRMIQRLTNIKDVDVALSEFTALRKIDFNICDSPRGEFVEYLEEHGFADINEVLDYELNITPIDLIKFLPDAIVCNELMQGAISKYKNKNLNAVMIALYGVLSHRPKKAVYCFYDKDKQYGDTDFENIDLEEDELTEDEFFEACEIDEKRIAKYGIEPLFNEEAYGALERDEIVDDDIFAVKAFKLQQALTKRLEDIKNSKK